MKIFLLLINIILVNNSSAYAQEVVNNTVELDDSGGTQVQHNNSDLLGDCDNAHASAVYACDQKNDAGIASAITKANNVLKVFSQLGAQSGTCSKIGEVLQGASLAMGAFNFSCDQIRNSCLKSCEAALRNHQSVNASERSGDSQLRAAYGTTRQQIQKNYQDCDNLKGYLASSIYSLIEYKQIYDQSKKCEADTKYAKEQHEQMCRMNPTMPGCGGTDCSTAAGQANPVCKCRANPGDPACIAYAGSMAGKIDVGVGATGGARDLAGGGDGLSGLDFGGSGGAMDPGFIPPGGGSNGVDSGKGASSRGIGTANLPNGGGGGAPGADPGSGFKTDILKTARGGAGGAIPMGGGAGYGNANGERSGAGAPGGGQVNLSQFLPGSSLDKQRRGLAGASGPDGITGPNSDIWQKISNRYTSMRPLMMP